jgi:hypothetical protein
MDYVSIQGRFSIDLRGTGLKIVDDLQWLDQGHRTSSRLERSEVFFSFFSIFIPHLNLQLQKLPISLKRLEQRPHPGLLRRLLRRMRSRQV